MEYYLGVNIEDQDNSMIRLTQPQIINIIIINIHLTRNISPRQTPALSTKILRRNAAAPIFGVWFNYQAIVRKLDFL